MKTSALLAISGGILFLGYRAKQSAEAAAQAAAAAAAVTPPPPNSGPVVNGLSLYQLEGLGGFGSAFKKAASQVSSGVKSVAENKVMKVPLAIATGGTSLMTGQVVKQVEKVAPLTKKVSSSPSTAQPAAGQAVQYQDANGATITEAQYNAIILAMQTGQPIATTGGWALPKGVISATNPYAVSEQSPGIVPPSINQGTAPLAPAGYSSSPNDNLNVTSSDDEEYGSGPATPYTAPSAGAPGLPGGVTTDLTTPAAQEAAAPVQVYESNTGKLLVGGTIAAVAAYLAFK